MLHITPYDEDGKLRTRDAMHQSLDRLLILYRLLHFDHNVTATAISLGVERTSLHRIMKSLGIERC